MIVTDTLDHRVARVFAAADWMISQCKTMAQARATASFDEDAIHALLARMIVAERVGVIQHDAWSCGFSCMQVIEEITFTK